MIFIYYVLVAVVLVVAGPYLLLKKKSRAGLAQKLGIIPRSLTNRGNDFKKGIWIHAVSVGEFNAVWPLLKRLREEMADVPLYLSTTTATAQALAQERVGSFATVTYFPLDLPFAINAWLDTLQPQMVAIAETEIWPGFAHECKKRGIKLVSINGRISPSSFRTYHKGRFFFARVLDSYTAFGVQTESEAERVRAIGGDGVSVSVLGNLKLDGMTPVPPQDIEALKGKVGLGADDFVLVAGSTHEGEESAILNTFKLLCAQYEKSPARKPRLIIAPRHPERFDRAAEIIASAGFKVRRNSAEERLESGDVLLLDSLGQLAKFYGLGSVAFVGGTLTNIGGHNVAEPYAYAVPVCCGPHLQKTFDVASALASREAILICQDSQGLEQAILDLYLHPQKVKTLGSAGKAWIEENQGAAARTLAFLRTTLDGTTANPSSPAEKIEGPSSHSKPVAMRS